MFPLSYYEHCQQEKKGTSHNHKINSREVTILNITTGEVKKKVKKHFTPSDRNIFQVAVSMQDAHNNQGFELCLVFIIRCSTFVTARCSVINHRGIAKLWLHHSSRYL